MNTMEDAALKADLIAFIDEAEPHQLKEIYELVINYFNSQDAIGEWDVLSEYQKERIEESIRQADAGLGTPAKEVVRMMRDKYGLNG